MIGLTNSLKDYKNFNYNLFSITSPLFLKIAGINNLINVNYWIVLSIAGAVIIFFIITLHLDDIPIETRSSRLLRRIKFPENKYFSLILKEFKLLARNEEVVFHYFFIIPLAIILRVKFNINFSNIFALSIFSSLCAIPSVSSFGIEEENINIYKLLNISYLQFTISKLIADLCVSILTFICFSMIFFTKEVTFRNYLLGLVIVFISVLALYLIGVIMPINDKRPYGQGLAVFFMVVLAIPLMQISNYISQLSLVYIVLIVLLLIILIFASIFYVSKIIWLSEEHG
jgi:hypothetical protein